MIEEDLLLDLGTSGSDLIDKIGSRLKNISHINMQQLISIDGRTMNGYVPEFILKEIASVLEDEFKVFEKVKDIEKENKELKDKLNKIKELL